MYLKYLISFIFLLIYTNSAISQAHEDSLLTIIQTATDRSEIKEATFQLGEYLVQRNPERAEMYANQLADLPSVNRDSSEWGRLNYIYAASHRWQGNYKTALDYYQKNYNYYQGQNDPENIARSGYKIGTINMFLGNNVLCQKHLLECAEIYKEIGTPGQQASINNSLASFYLNIDQEEKAEERYLKALEVFSAINDSSGMASINANLGLLYADRGEYEKSEKHLLAQKGLNKVFPTEREMGFHYDFMGVLRENQGRLQEAYQEYLKALNIRKKLSSTYNLCESRLSLGSILINLKKYDEAIFHLKEVLSYDEHESHNQQERAQQLLSEAYEKQNNFAKALEHYKAYKAVSDTIYNENSIQVIAEKDAAYKKKEQDAEIALLNIENQMGQERLSRSRIINYGSLIALIVFSLLSFFIYRLYRKIKGQNNVITKALQDKSLLLKEIHHRVKNNLQVVSSLLRLQSKFITDENALEAIKDGRNRVQSMAILHQNLYRDEDITGVNMKVYFSNLVEGIFNSYNLSKEDIQLDLDIEDINLDVDTVIPIGLITNELVTNSLKYAFAKDKENATIEVKLKELNGEYHLEVSDNGSGIDDEIIKSKTSKTFGQRMIHAFVNKLKARINISNKQGTKVVIAIPK